MLFLFPFQFKVGAAFIIDCWPDIVDGAAIAVGNIGGIRHSVSMTTSNNKQQLRPPPFGC